MVRHKASSKKKKHDLPNRKLDEFYSSEQLAREEKERKHKEHEKVEAEIFEHLKQHTKRVLNFHKNR